MRPAIALWLMMSLAVTGCKKKEAATTEASAAGSDMGAAAGSDMGAAAGSDPTASATPDPGDGAKKMTKRGGNCPSLVTGVTTAASADADAVTVMVTAEDAEAIASIQKRAEELLIEKADPPAGGTHDQKGTYGGSMGLCPIGTDGATAKLAKTATGVTVTLTPTEGTTVEQLKAEVDERIGAAAAYAAANLQPAGDVRNGGAVGGGKGSHGSNHSGDSNGKGKEKGKGDGTGGGGGDGKGGGGGSGSGSGGSASK